MQKEVIPTESTSPEVLSFMKTFAEDVLGKGVVVGKDTPNFVANRIGTYGLLITLREMLERGYSVGEVDSVTENNLCRIASRLVYVNAQSPVSFRLEMHCHA